MNESRRLNMSDRLVFAGIIKQALQQKLTEEVAQLRREAMHLRGELIRRNRVVADRADDEVDQQAPMDTYQGSRRFA